MTRIRARHGMARIAMTVLGFCGFGGCSGSLFQSKSVPTTTYLLSAELPAPTADASPASAAPSAVIAADLAVQKPRVRAGLDTDRIASLYPDRRLDYFAGARWSGPLDEVIQDLTVQAFRSGARWRNVSSDASAFVSGYWLEIEVADFQAEYSSGGSPPTVSVHLLARIGGAGERRVLGTFDAAARRAAADNRMTAIVQAYEQAAGAALADIVAGASRTMSLEHR